MNTITAKFESVNRRIASWMEHYGQCMLRFSLGIIFIWFGGLKIVGISPAADLVAMTVYFLPPDLFIPILGWWEVAIGVSLLVKPLIRVGIFLLFLQMPGTMLPIVLLPDVVFTQFPFGLTLEGQYIIKNLVLFSATIVIGGIVRTAPSQTNQ